jgi:hypothetical protein
MINILINFLHEKDLEIIEEVLFFFKKKKKLSYLYK